MRYVELGRPLRKIIILLTFKKIQALPPILSVYGIDKNIRYDMYRNEQGYKNGGGDYWLL